MTSLLPQPPVWWGHAALGVVGALGVAPLGSTI
jgi:hypothetical protein